MKKIILLSLAFLFIATPCLCADFPQTGHGALSSATGRFVFGQISEFRRDQFMLDTQTGQLWQIVEGSDKSRALQPILYDYFGAKVLLSPLEIGIPEQPASPLPGVPEKKK